VDLAWTIAVGLVLGAWFGASVVHQFAPRWWRPVNKFDACRLLPQWHFFAPRPGRRDHHLVVRDIVDDVPTAWRQIGVGGSPPSVRWVFNPYRYRQKALTDLINMLLTARRVLAEHESPRIGELLSIPYLAILSWVMAQPGRPDGARQFAVIATTGHGSARDVRIVYVSRTHALEQVDGG
jgi:hypothetical protein